MPGLVGPTAPPFLIEHDPNAAEWAPDERAARANTVHPEGGVLRLTSIEISMVDPARVASGYRQTVGLQSEPWLDGGDWTLAARVGDQRIVLVPADVASGPAAVIRFSATGGRPARADLFGCRFIIDPIGRG